MAIISGNDRALSRDIDVMINVSRPQTELTTDLSVVVAIVRTGPLDHGANRIRFFNSFVSVLDIFDTNSEAAAMARDFFAQPVRSLTLAIAQVFDTAQAGFLTGDTVGGLADFNAIANGSLNIEVDGVLQSLTGLDFSTDSTLAAVATRVQAALVLSGAVGATVVINNGVVRITSGTIGDLSAVINSSVIPAAGVDIGVSGLLSIESGDAISTMGYLPTGIVNEIAIVREAALQSGRFIYGYTLERSFRDTSDQFLVASDAQAHNNIFVALSNSVNALNAASTTDIGALTNINGQERTVNWYSDVPDEYPDVAMLALALSVNYAAADSTITLKFKNLVGITPVGINESELAVLTNKRYNTLTRIGTVARTIREGVMAADTWFIDERLIIDNFSEELQVALFNVFLREGKVPFTASGAALLQAAASLIGERYVFNGALAPRMVNAPELQTGERVLPSYDIAFTPLRLITASERATRQGPPFVMTIRFAGAIHSVAFNVQALP